VWRRLGRYCRFKDYDGALLSEFLRMKRRAPITVYNALLKENFTTTDLAKLNRAIAQLPTAAAAAADNAKAPAEKK